MMAESNGVIVRGLPIATKKKDVLDAFEPICTEDCTIIYTLCPLDRYSYEAYIEFSSIPDNIFATKITVLGEPVTVEPAPVQVFSKCSVDVDPVVIASIPDIPECISTLKDEFGVTASYSPDSGQFTMDATFLQMRCVYNHLLDDFTRQQRLQKFQLMRIGEYGEDAFDRNIPGDHRATYDDHGLHSRWSHRGCCHGHHHTCSHRQPTEDGSHDRPEDQAGYRDPGWMWMRNIPHSPVHGAAACHKCGHNSGGHAHQASTHDAGKYAHDGDEDLCEKWTGSLPSSRPAEAAHTGRGVMTPAKPVGSTDVFPVRSPPSKVDKNYHDVATTQNVETKHTPPNLRSPPVEASEDPEQPLTAAATTSDLDYYVVEYIMKSRRADIQSIEQEFGVTIKAETRVCDEIVTVAFRRFNPTITDAQEKNAQKSFIALYENIYQNIVMRAVRIQQHSHHLSPAHFVSVIQNTFKDRLLVTSNDQDELVLVGPFAEVAQVEAFIKKTPKTKEHEAYDDDVRNPEDAAPVESGCRGADGGRNFDQKQMPAVDDMFQYTCRNQLLVKVYTADITKLGVDVIVNAANERLLNYAGVAGAIEMAGGSELRDDCKRIVDNDGPLKVAEVVHTSRRGQLKCRYVVHTVGPMWSVSDDKARCTMLLQRTFENVLHYSNRVLHASSVAMPAVGTGIFGIPLDVCSHTMYKAIEELVDKVSELSLREVHLVNNDPSTTHFIQTIFEHLLTTADSTSPASDTSADAEAHDVDNTGTTDDAKVHAEDTKDEEAVRSRDSAFDNESEKEPDGVTETGLLVSTNIMKVYDRADARPEFEESPNKDDSELSTHQDDVEQSGSEDADVKHGHKQYGLHLSDQSVEQPSDEPRGNRSDESDRHSASFLE